MAANRLPIATFSLMPASGGDQPGPYHYDGPPSHLLVLQLSLINEDGADVRLELRPGRYTIGRSSEATISIPRSLQTSSMHGVIVFEEGEWRLYDIGSRNGTHWSKMGADDKGSMRNGEYVVLQQGYNYFLSISARIRVLAE